uniref:Reverse transcriptase domain-containing protein n=1 Tax=Nicotiana tabacum TaxID=4097 RepID=A0A1S4D9X4_TOBAC|nr:PREDICTED: uncharacterized protein LOC107827554 [Nicotiana tabacum]
MEYLNRRLKSLHCIPDFNFHLICAKMQIIQLGFADDLLLFCRGDTFSVQLLYKCFLEFSRASGLEINKKKSSIFFCGVSQDIQKEILEFLGIPRGKLSVRYLGVPLSSKRVSITQCQPLIEKLVGRITSWTAKLLSYATRLQLVKRVILWTWGSTISKKALLAWEKVYQPKSADGFNVMDISLWNKAAISKKLWNLCKEKNKLWIKWVHCYYIKSKHVWEVQPSQASWIMRKILKAKENFEKAGYTYEDLMQMQTCSIKHLYHKLRGDFNKVSWRKLGKQLSPEMYRVKEHWCLIATLVQLSPDFSVKYLFFGLFMVLDAIFDVAVSSVSS